MHLHHGPRCRYHVLPLLLLLLLLLPQGLQHPQEQH